MTGSLVVRDGRPGDVEAMGWASSEDQRKAWRGQLGRAWQDQVCFIVAEINVLVVGKAVLDWVHNPDGTPRLWMFSVAPECRSQGVGTGKLRFVEARAKARGKTAIEMCVDDDNPRAREFYLRNGYTEVGPYLEEYEQILADGTTTRVANPVTSLRKDFGANTELSAQPGGQPLRDNLARYYDQDAVARADRPLRVERVRRCTQFVDALVGAGMRQVLEVGLGPGVDAVAMVNAGISVSGVDLSPEHVRIARALGIDAQVSAAQSLPFQDSSFDAIWCVSVLMHMPDADLHQVLNGFTRVLRPGGWRLWGCERRGNHRKQPRRHHRAGPILQLAE